MMRFDAMRTLFPGDAMLSSAREVMVLCRDRGVLRVGIYEGRRNGAFRYGSI
jgi:hypothetical protein